MDTWRRSDFDLLHSKLWHCPIDPFLLQVKKEHCPIDPFFSYKNILPFSDGQQLHQDYRGRTDNEIKNVWHTRSLEEKTRTKRGVQAATIHQNTKLSCQWHQAIRIGKFDYSFPFRIWKYRVCSNVPSTLFHWSLLSHEEHFNHHCRNKQHQH